MAFYFRKFRQSVKIVPATKTLAFSSRINDGDKAKEEHCSSKKWKYANNVCVEGETAEHTSFSALPTALSALVPLSVMDIAQSLLPRIEGNNRSPLNDLELFTDVVKKVPLTCDDILAEHLTSNIDPYSFIPNNGPNSFNFHPIINDTTLERVTINLQHSNDLNRNNKTLFARERCDHYTSALPQWQIGERCNYSNEECGSEKILETLLMCDRQSSSLGGILWTSGNGGKKPKSPSKDGPSAEQLHSVKGKLEQLVSQMFSSRYDYSVLHKNVIFENNLFGDNSVRRGTTAYALELLNLRFKIHSRFSSTSMEVLNMTVNEDTGVVRIHWRLKGLPQTELLKFWRVFQSREEVSKDDWLWFEAFSYYHIGKDGLVHKHRIDRMLPGSEEPDKLSNKLRKLLNPAKPLVN